MVENEVLDRAISRLPADMQEERLRRTKRAFDLSLKHIDMPKTASLDPFDEAAEVEAVLQQTQLEHDERKHLNGEFWYVFRPVQAYCALTTGFQACRHGPRGMVRLRLQACLVPEREVKPGFQCCASCSMCEWWLYKIGCNKTIVVDAQVAEVALRVASNRRAMYFRPTATFRSARAICGFASDFHAHVSVQRVL